LAAVAAQVPSATDAPKYVLPPKNIVDLFDAEWLPQTTVSPNHQVLAMTRARTYPTIAELSQPMLRLAGSRVNSRTNGPFRASGLPGTGIYQITLKKIAGGAESNVTMPPQAACLTSSSRLTDRAGVSQTKTRASSCGLLMSPRDRPRRWSAA
jgi:hypothetical protein